MLALEQMANLVRVAEVDHPTRQPLERDKKGRAVMVTLVEPVADQGAEIGVPEPAAPAFGVGESSEEMCARMVCCLIAWWLA